MFKYFFGWLEKWGLTSAKVEVEVEAELGKNIWTDRKFDQQIRTDEQIKSLINRSDVWSTDQKLDQKMKK